MSNLNLLGRIGARSRDGEFMIKGAKTETCFYKFYNRK